LKLLPILKGNLNARGIMIKTLRYKGASSKLPKSESATTHCNPATGK